MTIDNNTNIPNIKPNTTIGKNILSANCNIHNMIWNGNTNIRYSIATTSFANKLNITFIPMMEIYHIKFNLSRTTKYY